jgi:hypothetical protein
MKPCVYFTLFSLFCANSCLAQPDLVAALDLYDSPESFKGKVVAVTGLLELHPEADAICQTFESIDDAYCLVLDLSNFGRHEIPSAGELVTVVGEFYPEDLDYEFQTTDENGNIHVQFGPYWHRLIRIESVQNADDH